MFISDHQIKELCREGERIRIDPFNEMNVGPNSYDLTLDGEYRLLYLDWGLKEEAPWERERVQITSTVVLDRHVPPSNITYAKEDIDEEGHIRHYIVIPPFHSIIVRTQEVVHVGERLIGLVSPRSNLSYTINMFHSSLVDTGFIGRLTARIYNPTMSEIWIPAGYRFMQIMFADAITPDIMYDQRRLSKNLRYSDEIPNYKIDKEWLGFKEPPKRSRKEKPPKSATRPYPPSAAKNE